MKQKKINLTKTQKGLIIGGSALLGATAIITPISVVVSQQREQSDWPSMIDEFDQAYGISINTYRQMKDDFRDKYRTYLNDQWYTPEVIEQKMQELETNLEGIDNAFKQSFEDDEGATDYTALTQVLSDYARDEYNITLERPSNVTYTDIYDYYVSLRSSFILDLRNNKHLKPNAIAEKVAKADENYLEIAGDLLKRYGDDTLSAWTEGCTRLYDCFVADSELAAVLSAQTKLKEFLDTYLIAFRTEDSSTGTVHTYDSSLVKNLTLNEEIKPNEMNNIFTFTEKATNRQVLFTNSIIPNFTVVPVLHARYTGDNNPDTVAANGLSPEASNFSNTYTLSIDWQIYSDLYIENHPLLRQSNDFKRIVAHLRGNNPELAKGEVCEDPVDEINHCKIIYSEYDVLASESAEKKNLQQNFFTNQTNEPANREVPQYSVNFIWPDSSDDIHYEAFWDGVVADPNSTITQAQIDEQALASAGLKIRVDTVDTENIPTPGTVTPLIDLLPHKTEYWNTIDARLEPEQIFVKYCDVGGIVTLENIPQPDTPGSDQYNVPIYLYTKYRNLDNENLDQSCVALGSWQNNVKAKISDEFFTQSANNYNKTRDKYSIWFDSEVRDDIDFVVGDYFFSTAIAIAYDALSTASLSLTLVLYSFMPTPRSKKQMAITIVCIALIITHIVVISKEMNTWRSCFFNPWEDFKDNLSSFKGTSAYKNLKAKMDYDKKIFPIWNDDHEYSEQEYKDKKAAFNARVQDKEEGGFVRVRQESCEFYSSAINFAQDPTTPVSELISDFAKTSKKYHVGADDFIELLSKFEEGQRMYDLLADIDDVKLVVSLALDFFLPELDGDLKAIAKVIKTANTIVKAIKLSVGLVLSKIKCSHFDRLTQEW